MSALELEKMKEAGHYRRGKTCKVVRLIPSCYIQKHVSSLAVSQSESPISSSSRGVLDKQHLATGYAIEHWLCCSFTFFSMFHGTQYSNCMALLGDGSSRNNPQASLSRGSPIKATGK